MARMREIKQLIIHCADTPNGKPFTTADIDAWHYERGFRRTLAFRQRQEINLAAIGYHFVIYTNGAVANGRHLDEVGAHVKDWNAKSIGICLIGRDRFSAEQWESLSKNIDGLRMRFPDAGVFGHHDFNPGKTCPGFDVAAWVAGGLKPLAGHVLEIEK